MHQVVGYKKLVYQTEIWLDCVLNGCGYPKAQGRLDINPALDFVKIVVDKKQKVPLRTTDFPLNKQTERTRIMERNRKTQWADKQIQSYTVTEEEG